MYNVEKIRKDFPIFDIKVNDKPNTFLDSGASAQKPKCVIDAMVDVYSKEYANVHRGSYLLSEEITYKYSNNGYYHNDTINGSLAYYLRNTYLQ